MAAIVFSLSQVSTDLIWSGQDLAGLSRIQLGFAPGHRLVQVFITCLILAMTGAQEMKSHHPNTFNTSAAIS